MNSDEYARTKAKLLGTDEAKLRYKDSVKPLQNLEDDPAIDPAELKAANERHDREHGDPYAWWHSKLPSNWTRGRPVGRKRSS